MDTSYDVRIWKTDVYQGKRANTHYVRWSVAGKRHKKPFKSAALADSFRSDLVVAARKGEAFEVSSGLPLSVQRAAGEIAWYQFACQYADYKWPKAAATTRRSNAEALTAITILMLSDEPRGRPDAREIRSALRLWAFNKTRRDDTPAEIRRVLRWVAQHSRPVASLADAQLTRSVLDGLTVRLDGQPYAPTVVNRYRIVLNAAVEHAVERKLLRANPIPALKWKRPKPNISVDPRHVPNPMQARTLLEAVRSSSRSGPRLVAFFGCLYYSAMRPEEAAALARPNLALPRKGWGKLHLETAEPHAGKEWTDSGRTRDRRQLKHREKGVVRTVPSPPELTSLIWEHIDTYGFGADGRLFVGEHNKRELPNLTIVRAWQRARRLVLADDVLAGSLAGTPYDLRHAGVSTWLRAGIDPAKVAEWAGHSVEILYRIYAKFLDGGEEELQRRIEAVYGRLPGPAEASQTSARIRHSLPLITVTDRTQPDA
ncbi:integrase [Asanoa sp. NPDC049518]|uniref:tyrosine-type recombinase/integrase n=1 Tax=unclassified Asanoa TaxID=2685164 RepID=UPI003417E1AA